MHITTRSGSFQFTGLDREDYRPLFDYMESKRINIRNIEEDDYVDHEVLSSGDDMDIDEDDEDDESFKGDDED